MLCLPDYEYAEVLKNKGVVRGLHLLDYIEAVLPGVEPYLAMALQQGHQQEEHIDLLHDIKLHWKQPKAVLSRLQTWTTQQPIAVEALVATLAGSAQVAARTAICRACHFMSAKSAKRIKDSCLKGLRFPIFVSLAGSFLGRNHGHCDTPRSKHHEQSGRPARSKCRSEHRSNRRSSCHLPFLSACCQAAWLAAPYS